MRRLPTLLLLVTAALVALQVACDDDGHAASDATDGSTPEVPDGDADELLDSTLRDAGDTASPTDAPLELADASETDTSVPQPPWRETQFMLEPESCDPARTPIVFVHGFLAAGDTFATQMQRFAQDGWCESHLRAFDWNSLEQGETALELEAFVDAVLAATGAEAVHLVGHSAGGRLAYEFLADPARAARVARYVHVASFREEAAAGPPGAEVPTLNLWSPDDAVIPAEQLGEVAGATNVSLEGHDHYEVATSAQAFAAIDAFLSPDGEPASSELVPDARRAVSGRAVELGSNTPLGGAWIEVWRVDPASGARLDAEPYAFFVADAQGHFGPFVAEPAVHYELRVDPVSTGARPVRYFREPFARSNPAVYLRTLPPSGSGGALGLILGGLRFSSSSATLGLFSASHAVVAGRNVLTVSVGDGAPAELSSEALAAASLTTIAYFLYDTNRDGESSLAPEPTFATLPFLQAVDLAVGVSEPPTVVRFELDGRTLAVPALPGRDEGAVLAVFD